MNLKTHLELIYWECVKWFMGILTTFFVNKKTVCIEDEFISEKLLFFYGDKLMKSTKKVWELRQERKDEDS